MWTAQVSRTVNRLSSVWGIATKVWTVGDNGTILKWNGQAWSVQNGVDLINLEGIWGVDENNLWAVGTDGSAGKILMWDGTKWGQQASGTTSTLHSIWGVNPRDIWAVGNSGVALHYR